MIVLKSTYDDLQIKYLSLRCEFETLQSNWNALVTRINKKGGEEFLRGNGTAMSQQDIKRLLLLCHPDRHEGKSSAVEMTQKLLKLRDSN